MDPLKNGPLATRELFDRFSKDANGFPHEAALGAAANILLNALRQSHPRRDKAAAAWDELAARLKGVLMEHYNGQGERRSIFPFHQTIEVPHMVRSPHDRTVLVPSED